MDFSLFLAYLTEQGLIASQSTFDLLRVFVVNGGWMIFFYFFFHIGFEFLHDREQGVFAGGIQYIQLAINVPKQNEQTPRAVENFFNQLAGAHVTQDLIEKYFLGELQPWFAFEIVSIEGYLQYVIHTPKKFRDLVEAAIYAQYPDAEVVLIEDYTKSKPSKYPNDEYDMWGSEFTLTKPEAYPILTYRDFEHPVTKEYFKDPLAALLEAMSRIGKGEECWFQIYVKPVGFEWQKKVFAEAAALTTKLVDSRATPERPFPLLHKGETDLVEAVHRKATKNGFKVKFRALYVAKKENYNAKRVQYGVVGALKQFSRADGNGIKPLYSLTGVTGHYLFKDYQKNSRKTALMTAYKKRSGSRGGNTFVLNVEELATIWHFPISHAVRAPSLAQVSAKRGEAPGRLPLETDYVGLEPQAPPAPEPTQEKHGHANHHGGGHAAPPPNLPVA